MAGTDFSHLTSDELIKGIKALDLPDYIRSKAYGLDVRETLAQMTEMTIQLGVNMGLSPDEALKWARKLQESVSQSEFDSWVATLLDGGPSIFMNTLSELQTTYPNGATGVALVRETDPAKIYVWNGVAWEDFGDYQGVEIKDKTVTTPKIADKAVTWNKTDGVVLEGGNLYSKKTTYHADKYVSTSDGKILTASGWGAVSMTVSEGEVYSVWLPTNTFQSFQASYFNSDGTVISHSNTEPLVNDATGAENYKGNRWLVFEIPTGAKELWFTNKVPNQYDGSLNTIVEKGSKITGERGYIAEIFGVPTTKKSPFDGIKWVTFGDSLTEANSRTTKNYHGYVADDLGFSVTNMGVGGTGYKRTSENNTAFYQRISSVPLDADVITIFGSLNDLGAGVPIGTPSDTGTNTLGGAINTTLDNLNTRLPVVPVGIISPTPWQYSKPWDDTNTATQYAKLLKDICDDRGIPFLDLYHSSGLRPWEAEYRTLMYSRDDGNGTHPDEKGHKLFYPQVREFLKTLI